MLDFIEFIRFIAFLLGIVATIEGAINCIYYPYFFIPKFHKKNNIKQTLKNSPFSTNLRLGVLMWLSVEKKGSRRYNNIVKHYQDDFYISQYLKLSPEVLKECKQIYAHFLAGVSSMIICMLLVYILEFISP